MKKSLTFSFLALLFFGPLLIAGITYLVRPEWLSKTTNKAYLIQPPLDLAQLKLPIKQGKWILLFVSDLPCEQSCQENIFKMRQTYLSFLTKDRERIARIWLTFSPITDPQLLQTLHEQYNGMQQLVVKREQFAQLIANLPQQKQILEQGGLFIVDPHGNILLSYAIDAKPKDILTDLRKLLKVSQIG